MVPLKDVAAKLFKLRPDDVIVKIDDNTFGVVSRERLDQWAVRRANELKTNGSTHVLRTK